MATSTVAGEPAQAPNSDASGAHSAPAQLSSGGWGDRVFRILTGGAAWFVLLLLLAVAFSMA